MLKTKVMVVAAVLLITTIGVFAGRAKFAPQDVFVDRGAGIYTQLVSTMIFNDLSTNQPAGYVQAQIISSKNRLTYPLVTDNNGTKVALYTQGDY